VGDGGFCRPFDHSTQEISSPLRPSPMRLSELWTHPDNGATWAKAPGRQRDSCGSVRRGRGGDQYSQRRSGRAASGEALAPYLPRAIWVGPELIRLFFSKKGTLFQRGHLFSNLTSILCQISKRKSFLKKDVLFQKIRLF